MTRLIKSPLRYPGGKSRAVLQILQLVPANLRDYREPLVGGGSVYFAVRSLFKSTITYWVNDLNYDLYCFWRYVRDDCERLTAAIWEFKRNYADGPALYAFFKDEAGVTSDFDRAVRFFIMNRITFSGVVDSGGYSQQAFESRFTDSAIQRLEKMSPHFTQTRITHGDYEEALQAAGEGVFIFLDPPYLSATQSRLYGVRGGLHTGFDHERFAATMQRCPHRWLITYDDAPEIRRWFSFATITEWELQYGMNNYKQGSAAKGKELFIRNY